MGSRLPVHAAGIRSLKLAPQSLFGRTATTIALTLLLFMIISIGGMIYFIAIPLAQRSADDFAAIIVSGAHSFQRLAEDERAELQRQLLYDHGLIATEQTPALAEKKFDLPYYVLFRAALARRVGQEIELIESTDGPLIWVDIPMSEITVRMGFDRQRVAANPPIVLALVFSGGLLLTIFTSYLLAHRVVDPLSRMYSAVRQMGHGQNPAALAEDGPTELANLARAFNRMSSELQELMENRTVIVAGIAHDLRTPLTRLGLAVEMLNQDSDPELVDGIRRDLAAMERLIGQFLQFSKGLDDERPEALDLWQILEGLAADLRREGSMVELSGSSSCPYNADPVALHRVLGNLMENAVYHGGGAPIAVDLQCNEQKVSIEICDRGPGIPADQLEAVFRPFHRLESARSNKTGGSGLGLAIARQLTNKHGWRIRLLRRQGGGTVARLELPVAQRL